MTLLIHSMSEFSDIILGAMDLAGVRDIVEVGAEFGGFSGDLAAHAAARGGTLTSIDPCPKPEFAAWLAEHPQVRHIERPSLDVLDELAPPDAWVIDGDHNYYTVWHELQAVDRVCVAGGKPLLAFLHDVSWPCARRDSYYAPDRVPAEWRQAYDYEGGVTLGTNRLRAGRGFRGNGEFAWAVTEGGPRNGVLTAVEDFVAGYRESGRDIAFAFVPAVFGLGVLFDPGAVWAADVAAKLMPYHDNKLLHALEVNRLRNYLRVVEMQDTGQGQAEAPGQALAA